MRVIKVNVDEELITRSGTQKNLINVNNRQSPVEVKKGIGTLVGLDKSPQEWRWKHKKMLTFPEKQGKESLSIGNSKDKNAKI